MSATAVSNTAASNTAVERPPLVLRPRRSSNPYSPDFCIKTYLRELHDLFVMMDAENGQPSPLETPDPEPYLRLIRSDMPEPPRSALVDFITAELTCDIEGDDEWICGQFDEAQPIACLSVRRSCLPNRPGRIRVVLEIYPE